MSDIAIFMILFAIILIIYGCIGNLLFYTESSYDNMYDAIVTLFAISVGEFDLNSLNDTNKGKLVGQLYIISFIVLCNILILNLLIAILSSTYARLEESKKVLYINEILRLRHSLEYEKKNSALISSFPPWNYFCLFTVPFYLFSNDSSFVNNVLSHICYLPVVFICTIIFIICNLILIPFAYLKGILIKFQLIFNKKMQTSLKYRILTAIGYFFVGILIVFMNLIVDVYMFLIHLYQHNINYRREQKFRDSVSINSFNRIKRYFDNEAKLHNEIIHFHEISVYMREKMKILGHVTNMIYHKSESENDWNSSYYKIKEYVLIKDSLGAGSIVHSNQKLLFVKIWRSLLQELKMNDMIRYILGYGVNKSNKNLLHDKKNKQ